MNWNYIISAFAGLCFAIAGYAIAFLVWRGLCRINDRYDREVIARGRDCELYDRITTSSAGHPTASHPSPAPVVTAVPAACEREAVGASDKPTVAGTSFPRAIPPDGFDLMAPGARQKIAAQLTKAAQFVSSGSEDDAHDLALLAVHELNCILHERRANHMGVVR